MSTLRYYSEFVLSNIATYHVQVRQGKERQRIIITKKTHHGEPFHPASRNFNLVGTVPQFKLMWGCSTVCYSILN